MATIASLNVFLRLKSAIFDRKLRTSGKRVGAFSRTVKTARRAMQGFGLALGGAAAIGVLSRGLKEFAAFGKQMAFVNTMLDEGSKQWLPLYTKQLSRLSTQAGQTTAVLSKGLFDILSAGVGAADAMAVLQVAARAAVAGSTNTAVAVTGLTSLLNAFQLQADQAERVADLLFKTVGKGVITFEELAANIGKVAPLARASGASMQTMLAMIATLTKQGIRAEQATTQINALLRKIPEAGMDLAAVIQQFRGLPFGEILAQVKDVEAAKAIAALAADFDGLQSNMEAMTNASGSLNRAYRDMTTGAGKTSFEMARLGQEFTRVFRGIGLGVSKVVDAFALMGKGYRLLAEDARKFHEFVGVRQPRLERSVPAAVASDPTRLAAEATARMEAATAAAEQAANVQAAIRALEREQKVTAKVVTVQARLREAIRTSGLTANQAALQRLILAGATKQEIAATQSLLDRLDKLAKARAFEAQNAAKFAQLERESAAAREALFDEGAALFHEVQGPLERYSREIVRINMLLGEGAISWDTFRRAQARAQDALQEGDAPSGPGQARVIRRSLIDIAGLGDFGARTPEVSRLDKLIVLQAENNRTLENIDQGGGLN